MNVITTLAIMKTKNCNAFVYKSRSYSGLILVLTDREPGNKHCIINVLQTERLLRQYSQATHIHLLIAIAQ